MHDSEMFSCRQRELHTDRTLYARKSVFSKMYPSPPDSGMTRKRTKGDSPRKLIDERCVLCDKMKSTSFFFVTCHSCVFEGV